MFVPGVPDRIMGLDDDRGTLQPEQKGGRSDLEPFRRPEGLSTRGFGEVKENPKLKILSQYRSPFITYKYASVVSSNCKVKHKEQY